MQKKMKMDKERAKRAGIALHNILTNLSSFKFDIKKQDENTWVIFHNLIILLSLRNKLNHTDWTFTVLSYFGDAIKQKLRMQHAEILNDFIFYSNLCYDVHPDDNNNDCIRIVNAFRDIRNEKLKRINDVFAYLLTETSLEIDGPYCEHDAHKSAKNTFRMIEDFLRSPNLVQNLQFETRKTVTENEVQKHLFEYFEGKGLKFQENPMFTGSIYEESKLIYTTSITIEQGAQNSVVMISIISF